MILKQYIDNGTYYTMVWETSRQEDLIEMQQMAHVVRHHFVNVEAGMEQGQTISTVATPIEMSVTYPG